MNKRIALELRRRLNIPLLNTITDEKLIEATKDTFLYARIHLHFACSDFITELKNVLNKIIRRK